MAPGMVDLMSVGRFHRKRDFQRHLKMRNPSIFDMATGLHHLKPAQVPDGLIGSVDRRRHGVLDTLVRCSGDFNDALNMIFLGHAMLSFF